MADEYDAARPSYPPDVFDALEPLAGLSVLDVGAGTGIATRSLIARRAEVVAIDPGVELLRRAKSHTDDLIALTADGATLPIRSNAVDLVCFAQAWHWLNPETRVEESHRVLRPGGRWAGWWSHARADGQPWFDAHWAAIERTCPGTNRAQRDTDWGSTIRTGHRFDVNARITIPWVRELTIDTWMTDLASHSYVVGLANDHRNRLLTILRRIVQTQFRDKPMAVPYETWLWIATPI